MKVKIKSRGYGEKEGFPPIIRYLSSIKNGKQVIINIDEDDFLNGIDLVFDNLSVSNVKVEENKEDHTCISTFVCNKTVFKNLLRFIRHLKAFGDCGHSFGVRINGKMFSWDGDGSDRVVEINDVDCGNGIEFDKHYKEYFPTEENKDDVYVSESLVKVNENELRYIVETVSKKIINERFN